LRSCPNHFNQSETGGSGAGLEASKPILWHIYSRNNNKALLGMFFDLTFCFIDKICHSGRVRIAKGKYDMANPLIGSLRAQSLAAINEDF
jgi:hypothetical protein